MRRLDPPRRLLNCCISSRTSFNNEGGDHESLLVMKADKDPLNTQHAQIDPNHGSMIMRRRLPSLAMKIADPLISQHSQYYLILPASLPACLSFCLFQIARASPREVPKCRQAAGRFGPLECAMTLAPSTPPAGTMTLQASRNVLDTHRVRQWMLVICMSID